MTAVPADTPATNPDDEPTVATAVLLLLHVPPIVPSVNVVTPPMQMAEAPATGDTVGKSLTVTIAEAVAVPQGPVTV